MRKELEQMATIENYISGNLSGPDKAAFEKKLASDPALQKEVQLQRELMQGIQRVGLKQLIRKGMRKYKFARRLRNWGLGGLSAVVIAGAALFLYHSASKTHAENAPYELPELNEQGQKNWSDADKYLPTQIFELNNDKDTVIETHGGIVFSIPARSFLAADGKPAAGSVQLEVREALNAADIMKAGLNTKSGEQLLESGGMFYVNARQNNVSLKIDPGNALYAEVPANEVKSGMQQYEGKRLPDGSIDWVRPKPIQKDLVPVNILSLDFYPPHYLDSLKQWGYNIKDKKFTDSLYYSFAALFGNRSLSVQLADTSSAMQDSVKVPELMIHVLKNKSTGRTERFGSREFNALGYNWADRYDYLTSYVTDITSVGAKVFNRNCAVCHSLGKDKIVGPGLEGIMDRIPGTEWMIQYIRNNYRMIAGGDLYANKIYNEYNKAPMTVFEGTIPDGDMHALLAFLQNTTQPVNGINPARIKAIWAEQYQNTLLATREFEQRLPFIFKTCNENVLNIYVVNLDKNLSAVDSMAYALCKDPQFLRFAARGDGKVKNGNKNVQLLKRYYEEKTKLFTAALTATKNMFWQKQADADIQAQINRTNHSAKDIQRLNENFQRELNLNLDNAYRQLGMNRPAANNSSVFSTPIPPETYGIPVSSTGWCNIDRCVLVNTENRTTIDYTDKETGKKALIKYVPINISVRDNNSYDRVLVYLLPDELNSFMRVENKNGNYKERLNELMIYKLVCLAYKGEESFYFSQDNVKPGAISVSMVKTTNEAIRDNVSKLNNHGQSAAMHEELNFLDFEKTEATRQQKLIRIKELSDKVRPVVLPCWLSREASLQSGK